MSARFAGSLVVLAAAGAGVTSLVVAAHGSGASPAGVARVVVVEDAGRTAASGAAPRPRRLVLPRSARAIRSTGQAVGAPGAHAAGTRGARAASAAAAPPPLPHASRAIGAPWDGRLEGGVTLPASGPDFFTWTLADGLSPSPAWRRNGTDTLVAWLQGVLRWYRATNPGAPRVGISDLSLPHGGPFGPRYGGLGHASHQNGLDVDVLYPRADHTERPATQPGEIDHALAQRLVDAFVAAGAQFCFVGEHVALSGPPGVVQVLAHHDDHVHVRIAPLR